MEKYIMYTPKRSMRKNKPVEQRIVTPQALLNIFWGRESISSKLTVVCAIPGRLCAWEELFQHIQTVLGGVAPQH